MVGHAALPPTRKQDPGILFPWETLFNDFNVGAWLTKEEQDPDAISKKYIPKEPLPMAPSVAFLSKYLKEYGYDIELTDYETSNFSAVLTAFKAHFSHNQNPDGYNSIPDMRDMFWVWALVAKYNNSSQKDLT